MLNIAIARALKRHWLLVLLIVVSGEAAHYWRHHELSLQNAGWMLLGAALWVALVALPVEWHRLRLEAAGRAVTPR